MKKIIHHLRRQSKEFRTHILNVAIILCAIVLFFLWIYSLGTNLSNPDTQAKIGEDLKPFSALKANIMGGYENFSNPDQSSSPDAQLNPQQ